MLGSWETSGNNIDNIPAVWSLSPWEEGHANDSQQEQNK